MQFFPFSLRTPKKKAARRSAGRAARFLRGRAAESSRSPGSRRASDGALSRGLTDAQHWQGKARGFARGAPPKAPPLRPEALRAVRRPSSRLRRFTLPGVVRGNALPPPPPGKTPPPAARPFLRRTLALRPLPASPTPGPGLRLRSPSAPGRPPARAPGHPPPGGFYPFKLRPPSRRPGVAPAGAIPLPALRSAAPLPESPACSLPDNFSEGAQNFKHMRLAMANRSPLSIGMAKPAAV